VKKNLYQKAHEDISAIIAETKARKRWEDKDIGMVLDIKASSVSDHRLKGTFPNMSFFKVLFLADASGYDIKFVKREAYR